MGNGYTSNIAAGALGGAAIGGPIGAGIGAAGGAALTALGSIHGPRRHTSVTFTDLNGNIQHANTEAEKQAFLQMQQNRQFRSDLQKYDTASNQFQNQVKSDFQRNSELQG